MNHSDVNLAPLLTAARDSQPATVGFSEQVYNLMVLVHQSATGETVARSANLAIEEVRAASVRAALSSIVASSKALIGEHLALDKAIPWLDPPVAPAESESRFMVPLHL